MTAMEWKILSTTPDHHIEKCDLPYGQWMISQITSKEYSGSAEIKFKPAFPEGMTPMDVMDKIRGADMESEENQRLWSYMHHEDIGYAQSFAEAKHLVGYFHRGSDGLPEFEDSIADNGFEFIHEFDNHRGHFKVYDHAKKKPLSLYVSSVDIQACYQGEKYSTNLIRLTGTRGLREDKPAYYLDIVGDYQKIVMAYLADIMARRIARGGLFKKSLTEIK